jgi:hypothetical protein
MIVDSDFNYYIGTFRRCPFDVSIMPQCLNVSSAAHLAGFDADSGNLFKFHVRDHRGVIIEVVGKQSMVVTKSLKLTTRIEEAALWNVQEYEGSFRGGPMDVCVQFFLGDKILCSREKTGQVMLMDPVEAEHARDKNGDFAVNIAWELTPDCDEAVGNGDIVGMPDWLRDMLVAG